MPFAILLASLPIIFIYYLSILFFMKKVSEVTILKLEDRVIVIEDGGSPEVHKTDIHNCMNCFSAGTYRLHVFDDPKKALSYQELNYEKKSKGYIGLEKYLRGNRFI